MAFNQDEEVDGKHRDEEVEFHLSSGGLLESGLLRGVATVRFSTRGLFVRGGPNENEGEWTQLNYLLAFPPGMKLKDIPKYLRKAVIGQPSRPAENWEGYWALETDLCQFKDKVGTPDPAPIYLHREGMMGQEFSCETAGISTIGDEVELSLKCAGEGMEYEKRVSIQVIGSKTLRMRRDGEKSKFFHRCD